MKKIYWILLALIGAGMSFTACNEEEPFSTATADDEPRIIAPTFPELEKNGNMKIFMELDRDKLLSITVTTTPADYTSVVWYLDGIEVGTEKTLEMNLNTGTYNLKVVVSTPSGKSTSRETLIKIKPLGEDPQSEEKVSERLVSAGEYATISGTNLDKVKKITLQRINVAESKSDSESSVIEIPESYINISSSTLVSFPLPDNIAAGTYRVTLIDAEGNEFGANTIEVTQMTLVKSGLDDNRKPGSSWTYFGINMDQIVSLIIGDDVIELFEKQNSSSLTFKSPSMPDGEYTISGKTKSGENVKFYVGETMVESTMVTIDGAANVISFAKLLRGGDVYEFEGKNISLIKSLFINNEEVSIKSTDESLTFTCPSLTGGKYSMYALCQDGRNVKFKTDNGFVDETSVLISSGTELFDGHYYVSWEGNPPQSVKEFGEVKDKTQNLSVGNRIKVYYSVNPDDEYHKIGIKTALWKELSPEFVFSEDGVTEIILTEDIVNQLNTEFGLICVGHGYYVDRVTYE